MNEARELAITDMSTKRRAYTLTLLDGIWFLALAANLTRDVVGGSSPLWPVWVAFLLMVAIHPFSLYRRFG